MPRLDDYFSEAIDTQYDHPLLRYLTAVGAQPDFREAKADVIRPRGPLGHTPTKLCLHFFAKSGDEMDRPRLEDWDDELNAALIQRGVRAISVDNEKVRFSLGLRAAFRAAEDRFGDGYYNGVLIHHIVNSPFKDHSAVGEVLPHVHRGDIDPSFRTYYDCREMIDNAIRGRAKELTKYLGYEIPEAEDILASAVAQYLDDRFSVTNRRILGLL
ncbi:MAG: hypothetical protein ACLQNE_10140 [Thermoguttaceae bacterium]